MNTLDTALQYVAERDGAQATIEHHLNPYLARYKEFLLELTPSYDSRDLEADTFLEIDHKTFSFTGEEDYKYGEYYTPSLNVPFAFVEDPEAYIAMARQEEADRKERAAAKTSNDKKERVARLELQLEKARAELAKAEEEGTDMIKIVATSVQVANLSDQV